MENYESTPNAGCCLTQFLPWLQNQDLKQLIAFGIGMILVAGKLAKITIDIFSDFSQFSLLFAGTAVLLGLGILEVPQSTKDAFGAIKEFLSSKLGFSNTAGVQDTGASTPRVTRSLRRSNRNQNQDTTDPASGE